MISYIWCAYNILYRAKTWANVGYDIPTQTEPIQPITKNGKIRTLETIGNF